MKALEHLTEAVIEEAMTLAVIAMARDGGCEFCGIQVAVDAASWEFS
jgi:hypothetical protein